MSYPESVSFDVRVTCRPDQLPWVVRHLDTFGGSTGLTLDFPTPDALPYTNMDDDVQV